MDIKWLALVIPISISMKCGCVHVHVHTYLVCVLKCLHIVTNSSTISTISLLLGGALLHMYVSLCQFLVDYKLYGMSYLHLGDIKFRYIGQENPDPLTCYYKWRTSSMESDMSSVLRYDI